MAIKKYNCESQWFNFFCPVDLYKECKAMAKLRKMSLRNWFIYAIQLEIKRNKNTRTRNENEVAWNEKMAKKIAKKKKKL